MSCRGYANAPGAAGHTLKRGVVTFPATVATICGDPVGAPSRAKDVGHATLGSRPRALLQIVWLKMAYSSILKPIFHRGKRRVYAQSRSKNGIVGRIAQFLPVLTRRATYRSDPLPNCRHTRRKPRIQKVATTRCVPRHLR